MPRRLEFRARFPLGLMLICAVLAGLGSSCTQAKDEPTGAQTVNAAAAAASAEAAMQQLTAGRQQEAEALLQQALEKAPDDRALLFLYAACLRGRFDIDRAYPVFQKIRALYPDTLEGQCAASKMALAAGHDVSKHLGTLRTLVRKNPENVLLAWMLVAECRTQGRNREGIEVAQPLVAAWKPGPAALHHTYANLLDDEKRHEDALVERRLAAEMDPSPRTYEGLGNTLTALGRFEEAERAFIMATAKNRRLFTIWTAWAWSQLSAGNYEAAIKRCQKAIELNPDAHRAWYYWGLALEKAGYPVEAMDKYEKALAISPLDMEVRQALVNLRERTKKK